MENIVVAYSARVKDVFSGWNRGIRYDWLGIGLRGDLPDGTP